VAKYLRQPDKIVAVVGEELMGQPGRLQDTVDVERHLADAWAAFEGNDAEGRTADKLLGRMERIEWSPPVLTFVIERHGRTCLGSTRADLYRWMVSLTDKTATCEKVGHRQLNAMATCTLIQPLAEEIANKITQGQGDERIVWQGPGTVRIVLSAIFPSGSGCRQTVEGRRKRFKQALIPLLEECGWRQVGPCLCAKAGMAA